MVQDMVPTPLLHHILHQAQALMVTLVASSSCGMFILNYYDYVELYLCHLINFMFLVCATEDGVYHSEDDPPPFHENQDFDFGLDNKSIRRAFIRKVRRHVTEEEV